MGPRPRLQPPLVGHVGNQQVVASGAKRLVLIASWNDIYLRPAVVIHRHCLAVLANRCILVKRQMIAHALEDIRRLLTSPLPAFEHDNDVQIRVAPDRGSTRDRSGWEGLDDRKLI